MDMVQGLLFSLSFLLAAVSVPSTAACDDIPCEIRRPFDAASSGGARIARLQPATAAYMPEFLPRDDRRPPRGASAAIPAVMQADPNNLF